MKRTLTVLIVGALLCGCWNPVMLEVDVPDLGIETIDDALSWVADNITYVSDDIHDCSDYWQDPYQTYTWRTGDCEDFSILLMYLMHRDVGLEPALIIGKISIPDEQSVWHGWVRVDGEDYEATSGACDTEWFAEYGEIWRVIPYEEAMRRSATIHRSVAESTIGGHGE